MKNIIMILLMTCLTTILFAHGDYREYYTVETKGTINSIYDPGHIVIKTVEGMTIDARYNDFEYEALSALENNKEQLLVTYSTANGCQIKDLKSKKVFKLFGSGTNVFADRGSEKCLDTGDTTLGMVHCADLSYQAWDSILNRVYVALGGNKNTQLKKTQQSWIKYRKEQELLSDQVYKNKEGSMWSHVLIDRKVDIIKNQVELLQSILDDR